MRTLGVQFRTSACDVTLSGLELVSKTTDDRKRVWCPPPTPAALPHLCSSTPSSRSVLLSCTHSLTPGVRRPRGCSEAGSRCLLCAQVSARWAQACRLQSPPGGLRMTVAAWVAFSERQGQARL